MKKYTLPNPIRITAKESYEVLFVDEFKGNETLGECRFDPKQIVIKNGQSNTEFFKTQLHEVLHAISEEYNASLTETQVKALEQGLYKVLRLNGWLK